MCEKALSGEAGALKERTLAVEVFGRSPQSDLGEDTIVRVGAREVRKRLAQYYVLPEGASSKIRIDLPSGSYVPEFRFTAPRKHPNVQPLVEGPAESVRSKPGNRLFVIGAMAILAALSLTAIKQSTASGPDAELFRKFWQPVLKAP